SYGATFGPDGRLYTVSYDGNLRAYDQNFRLVQKVATRGGKQAYSVAVDPAGQNLAVGFYEAAKVDVYRASNLGFAFEADTAGLGNGDLLAVSWAAGGSRLVAGGRYGDRAGRPVAMWDQAGRGPRRMQTVAQSSIFHLLPCGDGVVAGAADPLMALLNPDGLPRLTRASAAPDMRLKLGDAFQVSADGRQVRFGLGLGAAKPA